MARLKSLLMEDIWGKTSKAREKLISFVQSVTHLPGEAQRRQAEKQLKALIDEFGQASYEEGVAEERMGADL